MLPLFFLIFLTLKSHGQDVTTDPPMSKSRFLCAGDLYCSEDNKFNFFKMEVLAKMLEKRNFSDEDSKYYEQKKLSLCKDVTYAGFLLKNASIDWPISCLWTYLKNQTFHVSCAPTSSSYDAHDYIPPEKWSKMLKEFRTRIKCSKNQIEAAKEVEQLSICRERCVNMGINDISLCIIMVSLELACFMLLHHDKWKYTIVSFLTTLFLVIMYYWRL